MLLVFGSRHPNWRQSSIAHFGGLPHGHRLSAPGITKHQPGSNGKVSPLHKHPAPPYTCISTPDDIRPQYHFETNESANVCLLYAAQSRHSDIAAWNDAKGEPPILRRFPLFGCVQNWETLQAGLPLVPLQTNPNTPPSTQKSPPKPAK